MAPPVDQMDLFWGTISIIFLLDVVKVDRRIIYQVPSKCPQCGGSLSNEEVDWVGPLQAKCPFCRTTVEAQPTEF